MDDDIPGLNVLELQQRIEKRELLAEDVVRSLLKRMEAIDRRGPTIRSIIEVNPEAGDIARRLDGEPCRGPLHGIPILLKDNIDTADDMHTTAGSLALENSEPASDAFVVNRLREAGAILLGKANMSEWANFRSTHSSSGWSARGGQALNPYVLDRSPCGSSSGSASAVAAGLAPVSLGTETDGSILCPAAMCGVVGIKPTVGLTSRGGVIPISHTQDTVGPFARTVAGAALVLGAITGIDPADPATFRTGQPPGAGKSHPDYTRFLDANGLKDARIGIPRDQYFGYSPKVDAVIENAIEAMRRAGAVIVDPSDIATAKTMKEGEITVLLYEFKAGLNEYLSQRNGDGPRSLEEIIAFNVRHSDRELPFFGQELFLQAQEKGDLTVPEYLDALAQDTTLAREEGIDAVMNQYKLDALVMPTTGPAFTIDLVNGDHFSGGSSTPAAIAGYPAITIPAGDVYGLPVGITFMGRAFSEPVLIRLAYALEQVLQAWRPPRFLRVLDVSAGGR